MDYFLEYSDYFKEFKITDIRMLFYIIKKIKNSENDNIKLKLSNFRNIIQETNYATYIEKIKSSLNKIFSLNFGIYNKNNDYSRFSIIIYYSIQSYDQSLYIIRNPKIYHFIEYSATWDSEGLYNFLSIRGLYSRRMFSILNSHKQFGYEEFDLKRLKELLKIPKTYDISAIQNRVIKPIKRDLQKYFVNLKISSKKDNIGKSHIVNGYKFYWNPRSLKEY
ncbi:replication initiation protein [Apilactobacillus timberlakei]|uniref:replication initiation protein n=1 Tax=Apilactobacillus timberlakei TaxID=2008380 RepID=UPI0015E86CCE|nr:replication initiation protein [Apilactobacillus timberlakei]